MSLPTWIMIADILISQSVLTPVNYNTCAELPTLLIKFLFYHAVGAVIAGVGI